MVRFCCSLLKRGSSESCPRQPVGTVWLLTVMAITNYYLCSLQQYNFNRGFFSLGKSVHPRFAPFFQAFEPHELADITLDTIVFYVKGRVEGVPLYGVSGALGSVLNTKYIVKHRVQSGMLDKVS